MKIFSRIIIIFLSGTLISCSTNSSRFFLEKNNVNELQLTVDYETNPTDTLIVLDYMNLSDDTMFLYSGGLKVFGCQNFIFDDSSISYSGSFIHLGMPFGTVSRDSNFQVSENCDRYLKASYFIEIAPKSSLEMSFNIREQGYSGFVNDSLYDTHVIFSVDSEFQKYCLKIWTGEIKSPVFQVMGTDNIGG